MIAVLLILFLIAGSVSGQTPKDVRAVAKQGQQAIPTVAQYLNSTSVDTRIEAIRQLIALGGKDTIDPLIRGTRDADPEVQIQATDGLVNYYLPGYVKQGLGSSLVRAGASIRAKFSDTNDQVIDAFVIVRPDVIAALGQLARGGGSLDARANACRALGILRGQAAVPDLLDALRTKDNRAMYEALIALQKIRDPQAGPARGVPGSRSRRQSAVGGNRNCRITACQRSFARAARYREEPAQQSSGARRPQRHRADARSAGPSFAAGL